MVVRLPRSFGSAPLEAEQSSIETAVLAEKAAALGHAGRQVEQALAALALASSDWREMLVERAAERVWGFLVQRESCGLHDCDRVIEDYRIPREVLNRLGARKGER